jgi:hypothetical protein
MKNNSVFGVFVSLLVTGFGLLIVYVIKYLPANVELSSFINDLEYNPVRRLAILTLGLLANIPLLYFCQQRKLYKTLQGIFVVIISAAVLLVCSKFNLF